MCTTEKQYWFKFTLSVFVAAAFSACGKKEESHLPMPVFTPAPVPAVQSTPITEPRSVNPELYAKDAGVSDTAAFASSESPTVLGINLVDNAVPVGALITSIVTSSQATKFDLQPNDVIVKIGDTVISTALEFKSAYDETRPTMATEITLIRKGVQHNVDIIKP